MIRFGCAQCGKKIQTTPANAGRKGKCPQCGAVIVVPAADEVGQSDEAAAIRQGPPACPAAPQAAPPAPVAPAARAPQSTGRRSPLLVVALALVVLAGCAAAVYFSGWRPWQTRPAQPQATGRSTPGAKGGSPTDPSPLKAPPTLPDGRYQPGGIRLATDVIEEVGAMQSSRSNASPDGRRCYLIASPGGKSCVFATDVELAEPRDPGASPPSAESLLAGRGGPAVPTFERVEQFDILFSPDSKRLAWVGVQWSKQLASVVVDDAAGKEYSRIIPRTLTFSPDSKRLAYVAWRQTGDYVVVCDGKESKPFEQPLGLAQSQPGDTRGPRPGLLAFSPNSKYLAYVVQRAGASCLMMGTEAIPMEGTQAYALAWSPDSQRVAVHVGDGQTWEAAFLDGKCGKKYGCVAPGSLTFSPDSKRLIYAAGVPAEQYDYLLVDNGVEGSTRYNYIFGPTIRVSPDGTRLAFSAATGPREGNYNAMGRTGNYWKIGSPVTVVDGAATPGRCEPAVFSPDGRRVAFVQKMGDEGSREEKCVVLVDGKAEPATCNAANYLSFSPDSKHYAYVAEGTEGTQIVLDGIALPFAMEGWLASLAFTGPDTLSAQCFQGRARKALRIRVTAEDRPVPGVAPASIPSAAP